MTRVFSRWRPTLQGVPLVAAVVAIAASIFAGSFFVGAADPDQIELRIFEDIAGDGLADGTVGDANNPLVAARIAVYADDGPTRG